MRKIILMLSFVLLFVTTSSVSVNAETSSYLSPVDSAEIICSRLDEINEYALENGGTGHINHCKFYDIEIIEVDSVINGVYIDFNGHNGYVIVGNNLTVYEFEVSGKSINDEVMKSDLRYDVLSGIYYEGFEYDYDNQLPMFNGYDQSLNGVDTNGTIYNLSDYVEDEYGSSYVLHESVNATTRSGESQSDLSVYRKENYNSSGTLISLSSEGNCGLVAPYTLLKFYKYEEGYTGLPYGIATYPYDPSAEETDLYNSKVAEGGYRIYDTEQGYAQRSFSPLYVEARQEAIDMNGSTEGLTVWESRDILNNVMDNHGYTTNFKIIEIWSMNTVTSRIDNGEAILWSTLGSAYGNHTMFVAGYDIYVKETRILFVTYRTYKDFFEIRDGWSTSPRYYDFNGINGGTTLGSFVVKD